MLIADFMGLKKTVDLLRYQNYQNITMAMFRKNLQKLLIP
jgi:hypothetical protein